MLMLLNAPLASQTLGELLETARDDFEEASIGALEISVSDDGRQSFSQSYLYEREGDRLRITSKGDDNLLIMDTDHFVLVSPADNLVTYGPANYLGYTSDPLAFLPADVSEEISSSVGVLVNDRLVFEVLLSEEQSAEIWFDTSTRKWIRSTIQQKYFDQSGKEHVRNSKYSWKELPITQQLDPAPSPCSIVDFAANPPRVSDDRYSGFRVSGPGH